MSTAVPPLSDRLVTLLDVARSEAKRYGRSEADPKALALVLASRDDEAFDARFGRGAAEAIAANAASPLEGLGEKQTLAVLAACEDAEVGTVLAALKENVPELAEHLEALLSGAPQPGANGSPPSETPGERSEPATAEEEKPASAQRGAPGLPTSVARFTRLVEPDPAIVGREPVIDEILALLSRQVPATPLVLGPPGSGRTALLDAFAARLRSDAYTGLLKDFRIARLGLDGILGDDPMQVLDRVLDTLRDGWIVAIDDAEAALALGTRGVIGPLLWRIRAAVEDAEARMLLLMDSQYASRLDANDQELFAELTPVALDPLHGDVLRSIVEPAAERLAAFHDVALAPDMAAAAAAPAGIQERRAHPGLLVDRLDSACARAALRADRQVTVDDLRGELSGDVVAPEPEKLAANLRRRVQGQNQALDAVCRRLALTRAALDLRTERPDGVFLFVGPTGVGKTELARAICHELNGSEAALIRLDMSEYAHDWAVSRLVGPMPGYVGSTEPETWLTTRIAREPRAVLLLDEIEKAHPIVWNTFLQVFDAGRLSDSRGTVADFSRVIVIMTSNMGAEVFTERPIGFVTGDEAAGDRHVREETAILATIRERMPPELINRLDGIVVFRGLELETIEAIAVAELGRLRERLAERGYEVSFSDDVPPFLAASGYDRRYGARHLQRNLERLLLQPLVGLPVGRLRAGVADDAIRWSVVDEPPAV